MEDEKNVCKSRRIDRVEFMGIDLCPSDVKNPHLRRVIEKVGAGGFRFRYDDHSRKRYSDYSDYSDWGKSKYHERARHSDYSDHSDYDEGPGPYSCT